MVICGAILAMIYHGSSSAFFHVGIYNGHVACTPTLEGKNHMTLCTIIVELNENIRLLVNK